jgi:hypothetical protein
MSTQIENEVGGLQEICSRWSATFKDKKRVEKLIREVNTFNHTFEAKFPKSTKNYTPNSLRNINITDGLGELQAYVDGKGDDNFTFGIRHITSGINGLIRDLQPN